MLLLSVKPQSSCRQNFLSVLLTSVALFESSESSALAVRLEMATEIPSCSTSRAKSILHHNTWCIMHHSIILEIMPAYFFFNPRSRAIRNSCKHQPLILFLLLMSDSFDHFKDFFPA